MTTNNIGPFAKTKLIKQIANHCYDNHGVIHDNNLDNLINNLKNSSECYENASITDLFTADPFQDDTHDIIERDQTDTRMPSEYWKLTEYAQKCINPKSWIKKLS
jgi:hypothetical protein